jgi:hypothetical protein
VGCVQDYFCERQEENESLMTRACVWWWLREAQTALQRCNRCVCNCRKKRREDTVGSIVPFFCFALNVCYCYRLLSCEFRGLITQERKRTCCKVVFRASAHCSSLFDRSLGGVGGSVDTPVERSASDAEQLLASCLLGVRSKDRSSAVASSKATSVCITILIIIVRCGKCVHTEGAPACSWLFLFIEV